MFHNTKFAKRRRESELIFWDARCKFEESYGKLNKGQKRWCSECANQLKAHTDLHDKTHHVTI